MGAHSAGRKVRAPGRFRRLNLAAEALFIAAVVTAAGYAGYVSFEPPPRSPGLDPRVPAVAVDPTDPPVAPTTIPRTYTPDPTTRDPGSIEDVDPDNDLITDKGGPWSS